MDGKHTMNMKPMATLLRALALYFAAIILGFTLLVAVYALPLTPIRQHVGESGALLGDEDGYPILVGGFSTTMLDNFTDSIMLLTAAEGGRNNGNIFMRAIQAPRASYGEGNWMVSYIDGYAKDGMPMDTNVATYARYWHGYLVVLKPLLTVMNYAEIRMCNMIAQCLLLLWLFYLMFKRLNVKYAVALMIGLACLTPMVLPLSMQFSTIFYITTLLTIFVLYRHAWLMERGRYVLFFFVAGMMTSYFDFLTYPLLTLCVPLTVQLLLTPCDSAAKSLKRTALQAFAWGCGYALLWAAKWVIASLATHENIVSEAVSTIEERTSSLGVGMLGVREVTRLDAVRAAVMRLLHLPYLLTAAGILTVCAIRLLTKTARLTLAAETTKHYPSFLLIALVPFCWYVAIPSHTYVHFFFTYRSLAATVFAVLCLFFSMISFESATLPHGRGK